VSGNCWHNLLSLGTPAIDDYFHRRGTIMATMISEVYDAFIASGAPEDKARKAAEAMAAYDGHFNRIENTLGVMRGDITNELSVMRGDITNELSVMRGDINNDLGVIRGDINTVRGDINLLKWMNGITWALCFGILFKLFLH
jgi:hypothetical protein